MFVYVDDAGREQFLERPRYQLHRRRQAVRGGRLAGPTLARSISAPMAKTWPRLNGRAKRVCSWDIHAELEALVKASTEEDSDEEDVLVEKVTGKEANTSSDDLGEDAFFFLLHEGWRSKVKSEVRRRRRRRTKSEGTALQPDQV